MEDSIESIAEKGTLFILIANLFKLNQFIMLGLRA